MYTTLAVTSREYNTVVIDYLPEVMSDEVTFDDTIVNNELTKRKA